jgi:cell division protein FtsB
VGDDVTINGTKLPLPVLLGILTFTFWLGGLSINVVAQNEDIKEHIKTPAHAEAALATNTVQADVKHNKEEIAEIKQKLDDIEEQMAEDKDEILDAIRESG